MSAPMAPMEALLAEQLPGGPEWLFEPKWDGFRCIAVKDGDRVDLWSKSGKPLGRYFPEVLSTIGALKADAFTLDGELVIETPGGLSFDALQDGWPELAARLTVSSPSVPTCRTAPVSARWSR